MDCLWDFGYYLKVLQLFCGRLKMISSFLFNFSYIGTSLAVAMLLFVKKKKNYRRVSQITIGLYMLVYLGIMSNENMQIEGF